VDTRHGRALAIHEGRRAGIAKQLHNVREKDDTTVPYAQRLDAAARARQSDDCLMAGTRRITESWKTAFDGDRIAVGRSPQA